MDKVRPATFGKPELGWLCVGYGVVMLYSSTVVGPGGLQFVFLDPAKAWQQFLAVRFVATGSDQRADWIGNLLMLVPFGFLTAGLLWPAHRASRLPAVLGALLMGATTILTIKYAQLFFPPRTVTLNYITAQGVGAIIGVACFVVWQERIGPSVDRQDPMAWPVLGLWLYCAALLVFVLMPLDFALDATDLWTQAERLPDTLLALPGGDRPLPVRLILLFAATVAFLPVGMLLACVKSGRYRVRRGLPAVTGIGLTVTTGIFVLSTLVMGAGPTVASILYRTFGIVIGAAALRWLSRQDMMRLRQILRGLLPWMIVPYLLALLLVSQLLSMHWRSPAEALEQVYPLGLIPLFDYYIVSKAEAAKNIVGHVLLYMPIGIGLWLRVGARRGGWAFILAAAIAFGVELGRYFRPGLQGDINAIMVAGLSAMLGMRLMPAVWSMLRTLAHQSGEPVQRTWNKPRLAAASPAPAGETEEF